ncbi:transmembrane 220 family protein [Lewinella sp. 4G2]|uniref:transmembrane 220 family protein n=1 Tax=Lewinella sp. 4G2 TaxID=1803372 RepID=UPI0007B463AE|nr:transmembrane 220 family protein [Lewinella sp. 4G2]OAV46255.1 hypothetical protein A3850_018540 [Lewinella sp. 4G2]
MKYFSLAIAVLFSLAAYWQLNDPDPGQWVAVYGMVAYVSVRYFFGGLRPIVALLPAVAIFVWWCTYIPAFADWVSQGMPTITGSMKAENEYIELTREFLGLLLAWVALATYAYLSRPGRTKDASLLDAA